MSNETTVRVKYDFVGELENTSYIHSLILKEAGVL